MNKRVHPEISIDDKAYSDKGKRGFKKGNPGRPKGATDEFTTLKDAFINAFKKIGGEESIVAWLTSEAITEKLRKGKKGKKIKVQFDHSGPRKESFFKMLSGMLPKDVIVSGNPGSPLGLSLATIEAKDLKGKNKQELIDIIFGRSRGSSTKKK